MYKIILTIWGFLFYLNATAQSNELYRPFYHGVASGDPLSDAVIIWTRVTPENAGDLQVEWEVALDTAFANVVRSGTVTTSLEKDFTVKVDVDQLQSDQTYYYRFEYQGWTSMIGRTRTAPVSDEAEHLRFAVVSCSNFQAGFFNAYGRIADRNDLAAVIHLGDYIYEYASNGYGDSIAKSKGRKHDTLETIVLEQYRARYALYRLDSNLRRLHQQHPMICVWDDHESANDSYKDGAQNHTEGVEGKWSERKEFSRKAYHEWMPIREKKDSTIYRDFSFGNLVDLIMLDTRITGRDEQINDVTNPALYDVQRTMLGKKQRDWFLHKMSSSKAKWKIIGNQVIFSEFNVGWAGQSTQQTPAEVESQFLDIWDGYPYERALIMGAIETQNIDNVVFLTGDFHCAFAFDVADSVTNAASSPFPYAPSAYNPLTGKGSIAVEFATPSISSANFDENVGPQLAAGFQYQINNDLPAPFPKGHNPNPHMKYVDLIRHGYFILDIQSDTASANYYFVDDILSPSTIENFGSRPFTVNGTNFLNVSQQPSKERTTQDIPAPRKWQNNNLNNSGSHIQRIRLFPNPSHHEINVEVSNNENVTLDWFDYSGKWIRQNIIRTDQKIPMSDFPKGIYFVNISTKEGSWIHKIVID
ncbi:MAG: alkaline phosphatase D family protein [Bacteroidota bacterium]|nr:alkaline phosphatase D family protein [Bacteroidota bacterium]